MKLISHRGNINGRLESHENEPTYIDIAIVKGYDVEVDVWYYPDKPNIIFLGHDKGEYSVTMDWFRERITKLWIHCKNIDAVIYLQDHKEVGQHLHYFWHQEDDITLTSFNFLWTYPNKELTHNSICVMPELNEQEVPPFVAGICSDYIKRYKK